MPEILYRSNCPKLQSANIQHHEIRLQAPDWAFCFPQSYFLLPPRMNVPAIANSGNLVLRCANLDAQIELP